MLFLTLEYSLTWWGSQADVSDLAALRYSSWLRRGQEHPGGQERLYSPSTAQASQSIFNSPTGSRTHRRSALTRIMELICISLKDTGAVLLAALNAPACPCENRAGNVWTVGVPPPSAHIRAFTHNLVVLSGDGSTLRDKGAPVQE